LQKEKTYQGRSIGEDVGYFISKIKKKEESK
jgi:hypothetical protein